LEEKIKCSTLICKLERIEIESEPECTRLLHVLSVTMRNKNLNFLFVGKWRTRAGKFIVPTNSIKLMWISRKKFLEFYFKFGKLFFFFWGNVGESREISRLQVVRMFLGDFYDNLFVATGAYSRRILSIYFLIISF
jgi:hypothetical protein